MDWSRNIIDTIKRQELGYNTSKQMDIAYYQLKSLCKDRYSYSSPQGETFCPVFASKFCHNRGKENFLISANEDGKVMLLDTNASPGKKVVLTFQAHDNAIFDLAWTNDELKFITASGDHTSTLWQVAEGEVKPVSQYHAHLHSVKTVTCRPDDHYVFATGGRDGSIAVWDRRVRTNSIVMMPEKIIQYSHEGPMYCKKKMYTTQASSVTSLAFQDDYNLLSCSAGDGMIKVWDMRKTYLFLKRKQSTPKYIFKYSGQGRNGFSDLTISPCRMRLYANCIDNYIYCYDIGTYSDKPITRYSGAIISSFYIKNSVSPDGQYIASGSNDAKVYIWSVKRSTFPLVTLNGHTAEVTGVDFSKSGELKMVSCSDDCSVRVWQFHSVEFGSDPLTFGWAEKCENIDTPKYQPQTRKRKGKADQTSTQKESTLPSELQAEKKHCSDSSVDKSNIIGDLPNLVIDGVSPHIHECSPLPKNKNWLALIKARALEGNNMSISNENQPLVKSPLPINKKKSVGNNLCTARGSILKFFKVSSRPSSCDQANVSTSDIKTSKSTIEA